MNRSQIIAQTLEDMRGLESSRTDELQQQSAELDEYDRSVTIPELMRRLPDADILTCKDLDFPVACCDSCHYFYAHYDMHLIELPDGRKAWVCCSVRRALFHEPTESDFSLEVGFEQAVGDWSRRRECRNDE